MNYLNQDEVNRWTHVKPCRAMNFVCLGFDRLKQDVWRILDLTSLTARKQRWLQYWQRVFWVPGWFDQRVWSTWNSSELIRNWLLLTQQASYMIGSVMWHRFLCGKPFCAQRHQYGLSSKLGSYLSMSALLWGPFSFSRDIDKISWKGVALISMLLFGTFGSHGLAIVFCAWPLILSICSILL